MNAHGSYQFEKLEGRNHEANMLAERANMRLDSFPKLLKRHAYPALGFALEVGTAQGIRARSMAGLHAGVHVTGIDRSEELLSVAATDTAEVRNLNFLKADVYELPFADNTFDFIYARLVFMHLSDPLKALANLHRVLKPGGRLLIEDADRDCMFFEPAPKSFSKFWERVQAGQRRQGGDPNVGRKLVPLLLQSGFTNPIVEVQPILGDGVDIEFLVRTLMPSLNIYLAPEDRAEGEQAIADLLMMSKDPLATFYHFWFIASGEKI